MSRAKGFPVITLVSIKAPRPLGPALEAAWPLDRDCHGFDAMLDAIDQADERIALSELVLTAGTEEKR